MIYTLEQLLSELDSPLNYEADFSKILFNTDYRELLVDVKTHVVKETFNGLRILKLSSRHESGFFRIMLSRYKANHYARIHLWPDNEHCVTDIHDHRWPFASAILCGCLVQEIYRVNEDSSLQDRKHLKYTHSLGYKGNGYSLQDGVPCTVRKTHSARFYPGDLNYLSANEFHRLYSAGGVGAISFVIEGVAARDSTSVVREADSSRCLNNRRINLEKDIFLSYLTRAIECLS